MKSKYYSLAAIFVISIITIFSNSTSAQSFLKTQGKKIVNENGQEVHLKGMGLGGWLVPEGYMLQTSGFANSPTEIRKKIEDLIGTTNADNFYAAYHQYYVNKTDIDSIAAWGFNSIRIPFNYRLLSPKDQPGVYLESGFNVLDSLLAWCEADKIYLILDMHCAPGGQNHDNISDYTGYPSLWESTDNQTRTVEIWKKIAERYKNEKWIGGYDLINETAWDLGSGNTPLRDLYVQITNAIRSVDTNHILFIEGNWYATDFSGLTPPWDSNMAYSFHKYWNSNSQPSIQYLLDMRNKYNVPLWLGESGENSNAWFTECIELMNQNDIGWSWWPHKKIGSIAGPLSAKKTADYQKLLNYWNGSGSKPTVSFATNALINQAYNLAIQKCEFHPGVIDALLKEPGNTKTIPFTENNIPGIIFAVNYDIGKQGYAYSDKDYENVNGNGGATWNNGWAYRNDGVDIEGCSDFPSNGYDVGWTNTGEFLNYTVTIAKAGNYDLDLRIAGGKSGGKILVRIDGTNVSSFIDVPNTGGYTSWKTITASNLSLPAGKHLLGLYLYYGGFNVNYMEFKPSTTDAAEENISPLKFKLNQNYPNPFNPSTTISYTIPHENFVTLKIYDLLGNEVKNLVSQEQKAGNYNIKFNAEGLSSGIYFYRIQAGQYSQQKKFVLLK